MMDRGIDEEQRETPALFPSKRGARFEIISQEIGKRKCFLMAVSIQERCVNIRSWLLRMNS